MFRGLGSYSEYSTMILLPLTEVHVAVRSTDPNHVRQGGRRGACCVKVYLIARLQQAEVGVSKVSRMAVTV
jgi:hypothetical protein